MRTAFMMCDCFSLASLLQSESVRCFKGLSVWVCHLSYYQLHCLFLTGFVIKPFEVCLLRSFMCQSIPQIHQCIKRPQICAMSTHDPGPTQSCCLLERHASHTCLTPPTVITQCKYLVHAYCMPVFFFSFTVSTGVFLI